MDITSLGRLTKLIFGKQFLDEGILSYSSVFSLYDYLNSLVNKHHIIMVIEKALNGWNTFVKSFYNFLLHK